MSALLLAACASPADHSSSPRPEAGGPRHEALRYPATTPGSPQEVAKVPDRPRASVPAPPTAWAPDVLYVCVGARGERQTPIELSPSLAGLCRKHPEMGPCQYQRETCRRAGGRVFAADGLEITPAVEAEYDRKVLRARFRGD